MRKKKDCDSEFYPESPVQNLDIVGLSRLGRGGVQDWVALIRYIGYCLLFVEAFLCLSKSGIIA